MKNQNIINNLVALGIYLFVCGDSLKYRSLQGVVTDEVIKLLRQNKQSLVILLRTGNPYNLPMVIKPSTVKTLVADLLFWAVRWMLMFLSEPRYTSQMYKLQQNFKINRRIRSKNKVHPGGAMTRLFHGDCNSVLDQLPDNSVDGGFTDPPYGIKHMGKSWDKAIPSADIWKKYFRVLKPGAWLIVFSSPRQDQLSRMIANLESAGFNTGFTSLYWTYATGFPKYRYISNHLRKNGYNREAEALEGAYAGFQPKPAVEVIIVAMKPPEEKSYTSQVISNGKGTTWLDDCRIPYVDGLPNIGNRHKHGRGEGYGFKPQWKARGGVRWTPEKEWKQEIERQAHENGRFPANLLVSGDVLDDGKKRAAGKYSNFFSLDAWVEKNLPFLIVPKANKKERDAGCEHLEEKSSASSEFRPNHTEKALQGESGNPYGRWKKLRNNHPTVKPIELMLYLITMFTRPGDTIIDSYVGTGTTCLAAQILGRRSTGIELEEEYFNIAAAKLHSRRIKNYFGGAA